MVYPTSSNKISRARQKLGESKTHDPGPVLWLPVIELLDFGRTGTGTWACSSSHSWALSSLITLPLPLFGPLRWGTCSLLQVNEALPHCLHGRFPSHRIPSKQSSVRGPDYRISNDHSRRRLQWSQTVLLAAIGFLSSGAISSLVFGATKIHKLTRERVLEWSFSEKNGDGDEETRLIQPHLFGILRGSLELGIGSIALPLHRDHLSLPFVEVK